MKLEKAKLKDSKKILDLFNSSRNLRGGNFRLEKYCLDEIQEYIKKKDCRMIIAKINQKIVGVMFIETWKKYFYLDTILIDKNFQNQGIGSKMLDYLTDFAKQKNIELIELITKVNNKKMKELLKKKKYKKGEKFFFYVKELK